MGTYHEDEHRRAVHRRLNEEAKPGIEEAKRRQAEKAAKARRTKLHFFGLPGGRR